jgi:hypothetical protein
MGSGAGTASLRRIRNSWDFLHRSCSCISSSTTGSNRPVFPSWISCGNSWCNVQWLPWLSLSVTRGDAADSLAVHQSLTSCRFHLGYHTPSQILWGLGIGISLGVGYYGLTEYIPSHYSRSVPAKLRRGLLSSSLFTWLRIKDGWAVWQDGGHEDGYRRWRALWDKKAKRS